MASTLLAKGSHVELEQLIKLRHLAGSIELFPATLSRSMQGGHYRSSLRGRGMDFEEVRRYQPGDDIRSIDWRVTARTAKVHTKIFREEKDRPVIIAIDQSPAMFFGSQVMYKSVMAAQLATLIAWVGLQQNDKVGGIVFNAQSQQETKPLRNKHAVLRLLESVAGYNHLLFSANTVAKAHGQPDGKGSFLLMLEKLHHIARPGSSVYIISDFRGYDAQAERLLHLIRRHTTVHALIVADSLEKCLPQQGSFNITDGQSRLRFRGDDELTVARYRTAFEQHIQQLENSFTKLRLIHRLVWTHDDPCKTLLHLS
jgi:uncharacterized protein (DUF58 family)